MKEPWVVKVIVLEASSEQEAQEKVREWRGIKEIAETYPLSGSADDPDQLELVWLPGDTR